jgi:hypothetical protein
MLAAALCAASLVAFRAAPHQAPPPPELEPITTISADDPSAPSARRFGDRVAADGSLVAVAAPTDGDDAWSPGAVVLRRLAWTARGALEITREAELSSSSRGSGERFGSALSLSASHGPSRGDLVAVGVDRADAISPANDSVPMAGAVDLFERPIRAEREWRHAARLAAGEPQPGAEFGGTLAFDAGGAARLAVGAPRHDARKDERSPWVWDAGRVSILSRVASSIPNDAASRWVEVAVIDAPTPELSGWFGAAVALDGDLLAIGAPGHDVADPTSGVAISSAGMVFLYRRIDPAGQSNAVQPPSERYRLERVLAAPSPEHSAWFGLALALEGETLAVGAPRARDRHGRGLGLGEPLGCVYIVDLARPDAAPKRIDPQSSLVRTGFGQTLALSSGLLLVGAPTTDAIAEDQQDPLLRDVGGAWVYELDEGRFTATLVPPRSLASALFGATAAIAEPTGPARPAASTRTWPAPDARARHRGHLVAVVGHHYSEEESREPSPGAAIYAVPRVRAPP